MVFRKGFIPREMMELADLLNFRSDSPTPLIETYTDEVNNLEKDTLPEILDEEWVSLIGNISMLCFTNIHPYTFIYYYPLHVSIISGNCRNCGISNYSKR